MSHSRIEELKFYCKKYNISPEAAKKLDSNHKFVETFAEFKKLMDAIENPKIADQSILEIIKSQCFLFDRRFYYQCDNEFTILKFIINAIIAKNRYLLLQDLFKNENFENIIFMDESKKLVYGNFIFSSAVMPELYKLISEMNTSELQPRVLVELLRAYYLDHFRLSDEEHFVLMEKLSDLAERFCNDEYLQKRINNIQQELRNKYLNCIYINPLTISPNSNSNSPENTTFERLNFHTKEDYQNIAEKTRNIKAKYKSEEFIKYITPGYEYQHLKAATKYLMLLYRMQLNLPPGLQKNCFIWCNQLIDSLTQAESNKNLKTDEKKVISDLVAELKTINVKVDNNGMALSDATKLSEMVNACLNSIVSCKPKMFGLYSNTASVIMTKRLEQLINELPILPLYFKVNNEGKIIKRFDINIHEAIKKMGEMEEKVFSKENTVTLRGR